MAGGWQDPRRGLQIGQEGEGVRPGPEEWVGASTWELDMEAGTWELDVEAGK